MSLSPCCNGEGFQSGLPSLLKPSQKICLSPCCNGEGFQRFKKGTLVEQGLGLSPCCNGEGFQRRKSRRLSR